MKTYHFAPLFLILSLVSSSGKSTEGSESSPPDAKRATFFQKFDKDGDGKLSEEERKAAREEMAGKRPLLPPLLIKKFDKDGDGRLSVEEREDAKKSWQDRKKETLEKFDADGDGILNAEERRNAIQSGLTPNKENASEEADLNSPKPKGDKKKGKQVKEQRKKKGKKDS